MEPRRGHTMKNMKKTQAKRKTAAAKPAAKSRPDDPDASPYAAPDEIVDWARHLFGKKTILPGTICPNCKSNGVELFRDRRWTCLDCGATGRLLIDVGVDKVPARHAP